MAVTTVAHFTADRWLADTFSMPVLRRSGTGGEVGSAELAAEMTRLSCGDRAFFYARVPTRDVKNSMALCAAGFTVIDTAITLARGGGAAPVDGAAVVRVATPEECAAIPAIAATCFRYSRFHLDPHIPVELANAVKRRWMESYLQGSRGSALYAAQVDGRLAGFLAVIDLTAENRRVAIIDLLGVATEHQGKGVGASLVAFFVNDWHGRVGELRVGTQAANTRSLRLYEGMGFRVVESNYVLHAHYRRGALYR